jgi:hypothetical protein
MHLLGYSRFGGAHAETAALSNLLAFHGAVAPHTREPWTEPMLLGLGGGTGFSYHVLPGPAGPWVHLGVRQLAHNTTEAFLAGICARVGWALRVEEQPRAGSAENVLVDELAQGRPVLLWVDQASLPYWRLPAEWNRAVPHVLVACGFDEANEEFALDDRSQRPVTLDAGRLALARAAIPSLHQRMATLDGPIGGPDLVAAVRSAIRVHCNGLLDPPLRNQGLAGAAVLARHLQASADTRAWRSRFPPGRALFRALSAGFHWIETAGTGGGALRSLYADFLVEASGLTQRAELTDLARTWRALAADWTAVAEAFLPASCPDLHETRDLLVHRQRRYELSGDDAAAGIAAVTARLGVLEESAARQFPLTERECADLLGEAGERLALVVEAERAAATSLREAVQS